MTKDVSLSWTTRIHTLGSTGWKWQTSEWMFSRVERMLVPSSCWRGLGSFGCVSIPLHFPSPVLPERPTSARRRCDPGKGIIWLPVAPSLSPTRLARSSFLSVFLSLTWSLLEILPLSPGMDVPPETSKHVKKSTSQKLEDQKKVRHVVHFYHFRCLPQGWKFMTISSEMRFSMLVFLLCSKLLLFLYVLLVIYKQSFR